jgi:hypothetical protein
VGVDVSIGLIIGLSMGMFIIGLFAGMLIIGPSMGMFIIGLFAGMLIIGPSRGMLMDIVVGMLMLMDIFGPFGCFVFAGFGCFVFWSRRPS